MFILNLTTCMINVLPKFIFISDVCGVVHKSLDCFKFFYVLSFSLQLGNLLGNGGLHDDVSKQGQPMWNYEPRRVPYRVRFRIGGKSPTVFTIRCFYMLYA